MLACPGERKAELLEQGDRRAALDPDVERTLAGLRGSFFLVGAVAALLLGAAISLVVLGDRRRRAAARPGVEPAGSEPGA